MGYVALDQYRALEAELAAFCDRWKVAELDLLDLPESERTWPGAELEVLVTMRPDASWTLFDQVTMQDELSEIFGRPAHFISRSGVEQWNDPEFTKIYTDGARPLYVAG